MAVENEAVFPCLCPFSEFPEKSRESDLKGGEVCLILKLMWKKEKNKPSGQKKDTAVA